MICRRVGKEKRVVLASRDGGDLGIPYVVKTYPSIDPIAAPPPPPDIISVTLTFHERIY